MVSAEHGERQLKGPQNQRLVAGGREGDGTGSPGERCRWKTVRQCHPRRSMTSYVGSEHSRAAPPAPPSAPARRTPGAAAAPPRCRGHPPERPRTRTPRAAPAARPRHRPRRAARGLGCCQAPWRCRGRLQSCVRCRRAPARRLCAARRRRWSRPRQPPGGWGGGLGTPVLETCPALPGRGSCWGGSD